VALCQDDGYFVSIRRLEIDVPFFGFLLNDSSSQRVLCDLVTVGCLDCTLCALIVFYDAQCDSLCLSFCGLPLSMYCLTILCHLVFVWWNVLCPFLLCDPICFAPLIGVCLVVSMNRVGTGSVIICMLYEWYMPRHCKVLRRFWLTVFIVPLHIILSFSLWFVIMFDSRVPC